MTPVPSYGGYDYEGKTVLTQKDLENAKTLREVINIMINMLISNWKNFAYVDNPRCIRFTLDHLLKKIEYRYDMVIQPSIAQRTIILHRILEYFNNLGYSISRRRIRRRKLSCIEVTICQPDYSSSNVNTTA